MTTIYLTRHGETEWNTQRRMQGRLNSPLTELGKQQAELLGKRMLEIPLHAIYSSTAPRAIATAELVKGNRPIPLYQHEGFCEMSLGTWEGKELKELLESDEKENCQHFLHHPQLFIPPKGAESFGEVQRRLSEALNMVATKHDGEAILIVAHGIVMRNIKSYIAQQSLDEIWGDLYFPTALSKVTYTKNDKAYNVVFWNSISHYK